MEDHVLGLGRLQVHFDNIQRYRLNTNYFRFLPAETSESPLRVLSPRVGDVDLDGFPDLLITLYNTSKPRGSSPLSSLAEPMLLLNAGCGPYSGCHPNWRQFQASPGFMQGTGNGVMATFFDLYEDGKLDVVVVDAESKHVTAWSNTTQNSDAYFIKVIVLSGACYHDCPAHHHSYVPYGTNAGGQMVGYRQQRAGPEEFDSYCSVAPQIPQTSHFALQLPYTIFGLGVAPNFVDYMWVNVSTQSHVWPQIIPNSQLYVIPYPRDKPDQWDAKLIIFTSKNIVITGLSMVGVCAFVSCIIVALHLRERRLDHQVISSPIIVCNVTYILLRPSCKKLTDFISTQCDCFRRHQIPTILLRSIFWAFRQLNSTPICDHFKSVFSDILLPHHINLQTEANMSRKTDADKTAGPESKNRGWPKGKRRYPKGAGAPKQPLSGYVHFLNERRETVRAENPDITFSDLSKKLAAEWSALADGEKNKYNEQAKRDKDR